jgi:nickel/cobalt exporter
VIVPRNSPYSVIVIRLLTVIVSLCMLMGSTVSAHPHIFVDAKVVITFNGEGDLVGFDNIWTFDSFYSAWIVQGLPRNAEGHLTPDALAQITDGMLTNVIQKEYFTTARDGLGAIVLGQAVEPEVSYDEDKLQFSFYVPIIEPRAVVDNLRLTIDDPQYYVAVDFRGVDPVSLADAPSNCAKGMIAPQDMPSDLSAALSKIPADVTTIPDDLQERLQNLRGGIVVQCGDPIQQFEAATKASAPSSAAALDAIKTLSDGQVAAPQEGNLSSFNKKASPFGRATSEPGL